MANVIITPPASEPLTTSEAKKQVNVEHSDDDTYIDALIATARRSAEAFQWRQLMTTTRKQTLDCFPADGCAVDLDFPPLQSITTVKYYDLNGDLQTWDSANYTVDTITEPGRFYPVYGGSYPDTQAIPNAVEITYVCGYTSAANVPQETKHAMKLIIAGLYEHREDVVVGTIVSQFPMRVENLLNLNTVRRF